MTVNPDVDGYTKP